MFSQELLDDEASLSGDDIGSDPDDEPGEGLQDEYEAEEGDADQVRDFGFEWTME